MITSWTGKGVATRYNCSIIITHGAERICRTGICNLTLPIKPVLICTGKPKCLKASFLRGRFSSSTSPTKINIEIHHHKLVMNNYLIVKLRLTDLYLDFPRISLSNYLKPMQLDLPT